MADKTVILQEALDGDASTVILEGECEISATLVIDRPVVFTGGKLKASAGTFHLIEIKAGGSGSTIRDMTVVGAAAATDGQYAIFTDAASAPTGVTVAGLRISGTNSGVKLDTAASRWQIRGNRFSGLVGVEVGRGYGVLVGNAHGNLISGNSFFGSEGHGRHAVYLSGGASYNIVAENVCDGFQEDAYPIYALSTQPTCEHNMIRGNIARNCGRWTGDSAAISVSGNCRRNKVVGNIVIGYMGLGMILTDAGLGQGSNVENELVDNMVVLSGLDGVWMKNVTGAVLRGNTVRDSSQQALGTRRGIVLQSTVDAVLIGNDSSGDSQRDHFFLNLTVPLNTGVRQLGNSWQAW